MRSALILLLVAACGPGKTPLAPVTDTGECIPDRAPTEPGLHPGAGTTFTGKVGRPMRVAITLVAASDLALAVGGPLPRGLLLSCNTDGCRVPAGGRGCLLIAGTPLEPARVTLRVETAIDDVAAYTLDVAR